MKGSEAGSRERQGQTAVAEKKALVPRSQEGDHPPQTPGREPPKDPECPVLYADSRYVVVNKVRSPCIADDISPVMRTSQSPHARPNTFAFASGGNPGTDVNHSLPH